MDFSATKENWKKTGTVAFKIIVASIILGGIFYGCASLLDAKIDYLTHAPAMVAGSVSLLALVLLGLILYGRKRVLTLRPTQVAVVILVALGAILGGTHFGREIVTKAFTDYKAVCAGIIFATASLTLAFCIHKFQRINDHWMLLLRNRRA